MERHGLWGISCAAAILLAGLIGCSSSGATDVDLSATGLDGSRSPVDASCALEECTSAQDAAAGDAAFDPATWLVDDNFAFDLSDFPRGFGLVGEHLAFRLDLSHQVKKITAIAPDQLITIIDRVGCFSAVNHEQDAELRSIPAGDAACVIHVDVGMPEADDPSPLCFGFRTVDGRWSFVFDEVLPQPPVAGVRWARLEVNRCFVDAIEVVFDDIYGNSGRALALAFQAIR